MVALWRVKFMAVADAHISRYEAVENRVSERPITDFNSPLELLYAFRDAVAREFTVYSASSSG